MNRLLGGACVVVFALLAAAPAKADDFKGFYVGANFGGASANPVDAQTTTIFSPTGYFNPTSPPAIALAGAQKLTPTGFTGGGTAGYNFQHHSFVFGLEADYGVMHLTSSQHTTGIYPCCITTGFTVTQSLDTNWLFTVRPRVGFTGGPVFVYGTGGLAVTNVKYQAVFTDTFATAHENGGANGTQSGWAAGAGAEFRVSHHWSMKAEYLHANFGSASTTTSTNLTAFTPAISKPTNVFTHQVGNLSANIYRFGFNFRF